MHRLLPNLFIFLDKYNKKIFENNSTNIGIIYRNYNSLNRKTELLKIANECKKKRFKLFVSNNIKLAIKVKADGIYIPSFNKINKNHNLENKNLIILGSAHNQKEIQQKISQKCAAIFLSPIFLTTKSKKYLDIYKFNLLSIFNKSNFFALGGIDNLNINKLKLLNINGFGGIRAFKKKPALKRPVFLKNNFF
jgi:thiamine-phosphate pyrophosphorylase